MNQTSQPDVIELDTEERSLRSVSLWNITIRRLFRRKSAIIGMTKVWALELGKFGITVNCIVPGYIKKDSVDHAPADQKTLSAIHARIPCERLGLPSEVAELIAFLLCGNSTYITGQCIHIDGGLLLK